jgi:hypothetical protein
VWFGESGQTGKIGSASSSIVTSVWMPPRQNTVKIHCPLVLSSPFRFSPPSQPALPSSFSKNREGKKKSIKPSYFNRPIIVQYFYLLVRLENCLVGSLSNNRDDQSFMDMQLFLGLLRNMTQNPDTKNIL